CEELIERYPESSALLSFYRRLIRLQREIHADLERSRQTDLRELCRYYPRLLALADQAGPGPLSEYGRSRFRNLPEQEELLRLCWETSELKGPGPAEPAKFYARALLQPYAEYLASRGAPDMESTGGSCPFCGARPVAGILRGEGDGAKRSLLCSLCSTEWEYRRILCPACGEEDRERLPTYVAEQMNYIRVEACETCKSFIKSVDLSKNGLAVPVVDELASPALAIWADEHGYAKIETNLLG